MFRSLLVYLKKGLARIESERELEQRRRYQSKGCFHSRLSRNNMRVQLVSIWCRSAIYKNITLLQKYSLFFIAFIASKIMMKYQQQVLFDPGIQSFCLCSRNRSISSAIMTKVQFVLDQYRLTQTYIVRECAFSDLEWIQLPNPSLSHADHSATSFIFLSLF